MTLKKHLVQFEQITHQWIKDLDLYTEEQFVLTPDEYQWSIGQVYVHLIQSALFFHVKQIELCSTNKGKEIAGGKKLPGKITYFLGLIPPVRVHVPASPDYTPRQPSNKQEVFERLHAVIDTVRSVRPAAEKSAPTQKTEHPGFGYLNAGEWFQLIPMHYRHHRRQQARLNKFLGVRP